MTAIAAPRLARPLWLVAAGAVSLLWNAYGAVQFVGSLNATPEGLMAAGMTAEQAAVYLALPGWTTAAFALGVFGALAGTVLMLMRLAAAVPVLAASLAGYIVLFAADAGYGVFAAIPAQLAILGFVVAFAAGMLAVARLARARGHLG